MRWLKDVILDIAITLVIVAFAVWSFGWAKWGIMIYTPLMLLLKVMAVGSGGLQTLTARAGREVPFWFHHVLYAVSVVALLVARWEIMAGLWVVIWVLSIAAEVKSKPRPRPA